MTNITQAEFAKLKGWNKSTVTRAKQAGRLVMVSGLVDVEATEAKLLASSGGRDDVADRHAAERAAKVGAGGAAPVRNETRADAQARKESNQADILEIELRKLRGSLVELDVVDMVLKTLGSSTRARIEMQPDQLAPLTTPSPDYDENHALISESGRGILAGIADDIDRARETLRRG